MSDASLPAGSIPFGRVVGKSGVDQRLSGLPVESRRAGGTLRAGVTATELEVIVDRVIGHMNAVNVACRMHLGDFWVQLHSAEMRPVRIAWLRSKQSKLTDDQYKRFHRMMTDAGYVARRWPESKRDLRRSWTYFMENEPDEPEKPAVERGLPRLVSDVAVSTDADGGWYECVADNGGRYLVRIRKENRPAEASVSVTDGDSSR